MSIGGHLAFADVLNIGRPNLPVLGLSGMTLSFDMIELKVSALLMGSMGQM
jgi:hypothetical protein